MRARCHNEGLELRCTKATLTVARSLTSNSDKRSTLKDTTETYTAWFCSEIAVPFGPEGLYGLPGLILECKINSKIITATRVEYLPQSQEILPPKGTIVTPEQYNKLLEASLTRFLETNENTELGNKALKHLFATKTMSAFAISENIYILAVERGARFAFSN